MLRVVETGERFQDWLSATVHLSHWTLHVVCGAAFFLIFIDGLDHFAAVHA